MILVSLTKKIINVQTDSCIVYTSHLDSYKAFELGK